MGEDWQREKRRDHYYRSAKASGYRARSAYKLHQLDERFKLIKPGNVVVDLGCAPGGWAQVACEKVGVDGVVVGVDLAPVQPVLGATFIRGDMTKQSTVQKVLDRIEERTGGNVSAVDLVISDMSPNISGNYSVDQARSYWLCKKALDFAEHVLKQGGHFVCKVFEGEDFPALRDALMERFGTVKTFFPPASRKESSEVYLVAKNMLRPGRAATGPQERAPEPTVAWWEKDDDED